MTTTRIATPLVLGTMIVVAGLAGTMMTLEPEKSSAWLVAMLFLPSAYIGLRVLGRIKRSQEGSAKSRSELRMALVGAGVLLSVPLTFQVAEAIGMVGAENHLMGEQVMGIMLGGVLIIMGNFLPKRLSRPHHGLSEEEAQNLRRFAGWAFVLAGIGFSGAWIILPAEVADWTSTSICAVAVLLVIGRVVLAGLRSRQITPPPNQ